MEEGKFEMEEGKFEREDVKIEKGRKKVDLLLLLLLLLVTFETTKICFGCTKMGNFYREKTYFTLSLGKNEEK